MSLTNSPADYLPADLLRALADADTEAMATPVERALRAIPDAYMTPEVALRIVETLSSRLMASPWAMQMDSVVITLMEDVEHPLWAIVQRNKEQ